MMAGAGILGLVLLSAAGIPAQEGPDAPGEGTPSQEAQEAADQPSRPPMAQDVVALAREWQAMEQQIGNLRRNYQEAFQDAERERILADYQRLLSDARLVQSRLRASARARYEAAPNQDPAVGSILASFVAQDLQRDLPDDAWELGQLLRTHGYAPPALLDVLGRAAYHLNDFESARPLLEQAREAGQLSPEGEGFLEDLARAQPLWEDELRRRAREAEADDLPRVRLVTTQGEIVVELFENEAPETVGNFIHLVSTGFYEGSPFHRVLGNFMAQGGSNTEDGTGGPGYEIYCECQRDDHRKHFRGSLSMAKKAAPHTGSSQFFLTFRRTAHLDGAHTVFGRVVEGWEVLPKIQRRDPTRPGQPAPDRILRAEVLRQRDRDYVPHKVSGG
jgi:cyclophilin family peptidyl-prolyl cis-trans isomerase